MPEEHKKNLGEELRKVLEEIEETKKNL